MPKTALKRWIALAAAATPVVAPAQVALPIGQDQQGQAAALELGGRSSMDLIRLDGSRFSFPLRFAHVRAGSERVELDGQALVKDKDYSIDYATGAIYMMRAFRAGQFIRVQYKYDEKADQVGTFAAKNGQSTGFSGLKLEFNPQAAFYLGMGMTERLSDGTVLSSNVYGMSNAYTLGGGKLTGLMMVGERLQSNAQSMLGDYGAGQHQKDDGKGKAIIQNYQSGALGGKFAFDYQDVDSRFAGFDALKANGLNDQQVDQVRKERGMKRTGVSLQDLGIGGMKFSSAFRTVGDANGSINWRSYGFKSGGLGFVWDAQKVDSAFTRFNDLREADRQVLQNERGLDRQLMHAGYAFGGGKLSYNTFSLTDNKNGFSRTEYGLDTAGLKLGFYDQTIDPGFSRFNGLRPQYDDQTKFDVGQLQRESGMDRRGMTAQLSKFGGAFNFSSQSISTGGLGFKAEDLNAKAGRLSVDYVKREVDPGFAKLGNLSQAEAAADVKSIAEMVNPGQCPKGQDVPMFFQSAGIDRELWRVGFDFGGGVKMRADDLSIEGQQGELMSQVYMLTGPKYNFSYRGTNVGSQFSEITRLTTSEQEVFGIDRGLKKSDLSFSALVDKNSKFEYSQMNAGIGDAGAMRQMFAYKAKGWDVNWSRRSVDPTFSQVGQIMDPERAALTGLMGFDQTNLVANVSLIPGLALKLNWADAAGIQTDEERHWRESQVDWKLAGNTTISAYRAEQLYKDESSTSMDRQFDRLLLQHDLGRFGIISLLQEHRTFDGDQDTNPDSLMQKVAYQANLNKTTQFQTEQSDTRFDNGSHEAATTNTVSTQVTNRLGVSLTDTKVVRDGDTPDSAKRNYGFWYDFGKNVRLSYGEARDLSDPLNATKNEKLSLSPGQFAGIDVKSLQYTHDMWDGKRNLSSGNVNLKTVKPLEFGGMSNIEFFYVADTLRDMDQWKKENRSMGLTGKLGEFGMGIGYRSQTVPNGDRAIDRVFSFNSDSTGKAAIRAVMNYDLRTMPNDKNVAIRDLKFIAKLWDDWSLENSIMTNPLKADNNALLGGVAQDTRINNWRINYLGSPNTKAGFVFEELMNDRTSMLQRKVGLDLTLFAKNPSPLTLGYRSVLTDGVGPRSTSYEFYLRFDQRPGANQSLSFMLGNMNYAGFRPSGHALQDWSMRLDYGIRF